MKTQMLECNFWKEKIANVIENFRRIAKNLA